MAQIRVRDFDERMHTRPLILTVLFLTAFSPPALGEDAGTDLPSTQGSHRLLDEHEILGVGWVAWRLLITEPGSLILWGYDGVYLEATRAHWVHWFFEPDEYSGNYAHGWNWDDHTYAQVAGEGLVNECNCRDRVLRQDYWGWWGPGEYTLIAVIATDGLFDGRITLHVDPGVLLLAKTSGTDVYSFSEPEFRSAASVVYRHDGPGSELLITKATLVGSQTVEIENEMWGQMFVSDASLSVCVSFCVTTGTKSYKAAWEGPNGLGAESPLPPTSWVWLQNMVELEAGEYTFRVDLDAQHTTTGPRPSFFALAADIVRP